MQSIELIITLACIIGFGLLVLVGFICLKKYFRIKWEKCCDAVFTCGGKYPSEKTEELKKQEERSGRHQNSSSVLNQPSYFGGRKRPEEIEPLAVDNMHSQQPTIYTDQDDVEAANDDVPIVPSGRNSATGSVSKQQTYYTSSAQRGYSSSSRGPSRSADPYRDVLVADDDEATL